MNATQITSHLTTTTINSNNGNNSNSSVTNPNLVMATSRHPIISIKEVTATYVNAYGEQCIGPAAAADMLAGDELVRFAGYAVTDLPAFKAIVTRHVRLNASLRVVVRRNGEEVCTTLHVGSRLN
uniref:3-dehydroquinate synthase n=1 Tax=Lygus hesperus TaxID=30085 RepID=A0A0A9Z6V0_LYGHE